jgi:hypothetical protein
MPASPAEAIMRRQLRNLLACAGPDLIFGLAGFFWPRGVRPALGIVLNLAQFIASEDSHERTNLHLVVWEGSSVTAKASEFDK